jgi:hypothetical protein
MAVDASIFSAAEPGLGYFYQSRFALLKSLGLPEDCFIHIERNDDREEPRRPPATCYSPRLPSPPVRF